MLSFLLAVAFVFFADVEAEARDIARALACPICQNISVADSPTELAGQMRDTVRKKLEAGESREQIFAYFVDRYGEDVLLDPPKRGFTLLVWSAPILALLLGAAVLWTVLARWRRPSTAAAPLTTEQEAHYAARLRRDLSAPETPP